MTWIHTFSGAALDLLDPQPDQIRLIDIAHSLSLQCRYTGHAKRFYSVAEHSVMVGSELLLETGDLACAWAGLMHDAHEAYCGDVASPIKRCLGDAWRSFEGKLEAAVKSKYGIAEFPEVHKADLRALYTERESVLSWPPPRDWQLPRAEKFNRPLLDLDSYRARSAFLMHALAYAPDRTIESEAEKALADLDAMAL